MYKPKWSKAKKQLKNFLCEPLYKRVDFHVINYRNAHDGLGRVVITVDKEEIVSMCTITAQREEFYCAKNIRAEQNNYHWDDIDQNRAIQNEAHNVLKKNGVYAQYDFFDILEQYFEKPIEQLLESTDSLMKILCLLDRRVGKRKLLKMEQEITKSGEWVQYFYQLRCEVENIRI